MWFALTVAGEWAAFIFSLGVENGPSFMASKGPLEEPRARDTGGDIFAGLGTYERGGGSVNNPFGRRSPGAAVGPNELRGWSPWVMQWTKGTNEPYFLNGRSLSFFFPFSFSLSLLLFLSLINPCPMYSYNVINVHI